MLSEVVSMVLVDWAMDMDRSPSPIGVPVLVRLKNVLNTEFFLPVEVLSADGFLSAGPAPEELIFADHVFCGWPPRP
jgi:hypothetical protein